MPLLDRLGDRTSGVLRRMMARADDNVEHEKVAEVAMRVGVEVINQYGPQEFAEDFEALAVAAFDDNEKLWFGEWIARDQVRKMARTFARRLAGLSPE